MRPLVGLVTFAVLACPAACASSAPPAVSPEPAPSAVAAVTKPPPNDCGGSGSARPCGGPKGDPEPPRRLCTDLPCLKSVKIAHRLAGAELAKGKHTFEVDADGTKSTCVVAVTEFAADAEAVCSGGARLSLSPRSETTVVPPKPEAGPNAPAVATRTVVPNSTEWRLVLEGTTPAVVRVVHKLGAKTVADHEIAPKYEERSPNGKGCPSTCSQANETIP